MWTARDALVPLLMVSLIVFLAGVAFDSWPEEWGGGSAPEQPGPDFQLYECVKASELGDPISVSGAGELVEIAGTSYVRFSAVGTAFLVSDSGRTSSLSVGPAMLDLVLLTGQSNALRYTAPDYLYGSFDLEPGRAFYLGQEGSGSTTGIATAETLAEARIMDLVADDGTSRVAQMYPAFCSGYVEETGHRVLVVNSAIGGKAISSWDDGNEADLWTKAVLARVSEIASGGDVVLDASHVLWSQGESDARKDVGQYVTRLKALVGKLTEGRYEGYAFDDVLSVLPIQRGYDNPINPARAQMQVAAEDPLFKIASTLPLRFSYEEQTVDGIHYTPQVYGWLGEAFARSAAEAAGMAPEAQTIVLAEDVGSPAELPAAVTAYGTSGQSFRLVAEWSETSPGTYSATLSGNPLGTRILPGLEAQATSGE